MRHSLDVFRLIIDVESPVFIGNGSEISKKEYLQLRGGQLAILDIEKLYMYLKKRHMEDAFEAFMLKKEKESLEQWFYNMHLKTEDVKDCFKYIVKSDSVSLQKGTPQQIFPFVKDPYGKPYVPGSSVKGMLRTILLGADIIQNSEKYACEARYFEKNLKESHPRNRKLLNQDILKIEAIRFRYLNRSENSRDAVHDALSGCVISDSDPLDIKDLVVCQRIEKHVDGKERRLNVLRECLKPGTHICCSMTLDRSLCQLKPDEVKNAVAIFGKRYYDDYMRKFPSKIAYAKDRVFLGGGCGFVSKTMVYPMFPGMKGVRVTQEIFEKKGVPRKHMHDRDLEYGVSPHILKCTSLQKQLMPMGACRLRLEN